MIHVVSASLLFLLESGPQEPQAILPGRVIDDAGRPVPGAEVLLFASDPLGVDTALWTSSDDDGRFRFGLPGKALDRVFRRGGAVWARMDGRTPDFRLLNPFFPLGGRSFTLVLRDPPSAPNVRLLAPDGRPVSGARLSATVLKRENGNRTVPDPIADHFEALTSLLPVAERLDPNLVRPLLWKAVSFRMPRPRLDRLALPRGIALAADAPLALFVARYDRDVARQLLERAGTEIASLDANAHETLRALFAAWAVVDPERGIATSTICQGTRIGKGRSGCATPTGPA